MGRRIHSQLPPQGNFVHRGQRAASRKARKWEEACSKIVPFQRGANGVRAEVPMQNFALPVEPEVLHGNRVRIHRPNSVLKYSLLMLMMIGSRVCKADADFTGGSDAQGLSRFHQDENLVGFDYEGGIDPLDVVALNSKDIITVPTETRAHFDQEGYMPNQSLFVTKDGLETTEIRHDLIRSAKQSVEISGNFGGGEVFLETMETIDHSLKKNKELKVHLLFSRDFIEEKDQKALDQLKEKYGERVHYQLSARIFLDSAFSNIENHVKMTVVDGKYMIVGGTGITDNFVTPGDVAPPEMEMKSWAEMIIPRGARDADFVAVGDVAKKGRAEFYKLFKKWERIMQDNQPAPLRWFPLEDKNVAQATLPNHNKRMEDDISMKLVTCGPEQTRNQCTEAIVERMLSADQALHVSHMYQNYVPEIDTAMDMLLRRGDLDLKVLTNKWWGNSPLRNVIMYSAFKVKSHPRMDVRYFDVENILFHKKIFIIKSSSETCIMNGSYNLGQKSHGRDDEVVLIACKHFNATGPAFQEAMDSFDKDWSLSVPDTGTFIERLGRGFVVNMIKVLQGGTEFLGSRAV